jgi:3-dehydroquinate synthase
MEIVHVELNERSYPIYIESSILAQLGSLYRTHQLGRRTAVITDETVASLYADCALGSLRAAEVQTTLIVIPPGEEQKSLPVADQIYAQLIDAGQDRTSSIIALGGGVIGDLAGFVAATYLRGISFVQVPTTLLAQVDSSIGGKTGVNHRLGKNLIGAFYQPQFVLIDPMLVKTLPRRQFYSGMGEVVKYGLIRDLRLVEQLEAFSKLDTLVDDLSALSQIIASCCRIKATITSQDEQEADLRRLLNFGHTLGHALEAASHYELTHGEAITWGMVAAAWLSHQKGYLHQAELDRVFSLLAKLPGPALASYDAETVLGYSNRDKKVKDGKRHFILLKHVGEAFVCPEISESDLRDALKFLQGRPLVQR